MHYKSPIELHLYKFNTNAFLLGKCQSWVEKNTLAEKGELSVQSLYCMQMQAKLSSMFPVQMGYIDVNMGGERLAHRIGEKLHFHCL